MSVPFRPEIFGGNAAVLVEAALGADLTQPAASWQWTDVTPDVMQAPGLAGTWGRADETSQTTPANLTFSLLNTNGPYSAYAAGINFNSKATPIRLRRNLTGVVASDSFTRTVAGGWGTPTVGPAYTLQGTAGDFSTDGAHGVIAPTTNSSDRMAVLALGQTDMNLSVQLVGVPTPSSGVNNQGLVGRYVDANNLYFAYAQAATSGALTLTLAVKSGGVFTVLATAPTTLTTADTMMLRFQLVGSTQRMRLWKAGTPEPDAWGVTVTDTSVTGTSGGSYAYDQNNTFINFFFDNLANDPFAIEFQGRSVGFTPTWDTTGRLPIVQVVAAGRMRQLGQPKVPAQSAQLRTVSQLPGLLAYWAMEDGATAKASSATVGPYPLTVNNGTATFGATAGPGAAGAVNFANNLVMQGTVPVAASNASWRVTFSYQYTGGAFQFYPMYWSTPTGDWVMRFDASIGNPLVMNIDFVTPASSFTQTFITPWTVTDQTWHTVQVIAVQNGANIDVAVCFDGSHWLNAPSMLTATTLTAVHTVWPGRNTVFTGASTLSTAVLVNHIAVASPTVINPSLTVPNIPQAVLAFVGETADVRLARIFAEEGVPFALTGTSNITCGPQPIDTPLNIARDAEKSDGGVLYDGFSDGVGYITRSARYNMTAAFTLDAGANSQLAPPFAPADDDQRTVNQYAASRTNGGTVTVSDTTSPQSITAIGVYPQGDTFNIADDTFLQGIAGWRVNLGTVNGLRYPTMQINFINSLAAALAPSWMAAIGSSRPISFRVDVINVSTSAVNHPPGTLLLIVEGYAVASDLKSWSVTANCVAYSPNRGFTIGSATQGRVDAANTTTNATLTLTQTGSCSMTVGAFPWTTTAQFPADFPLDININGEQVTVSAVAAPTGTTQPFTISARSVNGVRMTHAVGEKVSVWMPGKVLL